MGIDNGLVSVIIPTYNCAEFIGSAVSSILEQTYRNLEVIVVDDGSSDKTCEVLNDFRNLICYIKQENQGVSVARNKGIEQAQGAFVAFLDADDMWLPRKLEIQIRILTMCNNVAGLFTDFSKISSEGRTISRRGLTSHYGIFQREHLRPEFLFSESGVVDIQNQCSSNDGKVLFYYGNIFSYLYLGNFISTPSVILRRDAIDSVGEFATWLRTQEDYHYWLRLAERYLLGYVDAPLVAIRTRSNQLTAKEQRLEIAYKSLEVVEEIAPIASRLLGEALVNRRLCERYLHLSLVCLGRNDKRSARDAIGRAIKLVPSNVILYCVFLITFFPEKLIGLFRSVFRNIAGGGLPDFRCLKSTRKQKP